MDLKRRPEEAMAPLREERAINMAHKLLLEGAQIVDNCLFNITVKGATIDQKAQKFLGPLKKHHY